MSDEEIKRKNLDLIAYLVEKILNTIEKININNQEEQPEVIDMPELENKESAAQRQQKEQGLRILAPKQMIIRLAILLAQLKAGNNSEKLKNEIIQIAYSLFVQIKNPKQSSL